MRKDPYAKERAELRQKTKGLSDPMQKFYSMLLENAKGEKGDTPVKGKDYFTPAERKEMIAEILEKIPVPKDADLIDYDLILTYITQEVEEKVKKEVAKIPKPKNGEPGKDAVVDISAIVSSLLKVMPKMESKDVDYLGIKDYIDKEVGKIKKMKPQVVKSFTGGGATSLTQLIDADLSGLSKNANGQYILGSGGGGSTTFTALTDTPASYTSQGGKLVRVNTAENALEFIDPPSGTGDVSGPASATNNNIALFDGITGKLIKDSGVATSAFATSAQGALADTASQPGHTHVASDVTDFQTAVSANTDVAANTGARHSAVTLAGVPDYITLAGQVITRSLINLASHVTGRLPFANLTQLSAHQVLGRAGSGTGDVAGITMGNDTILGRSGSGNVDALSATQVRTILNVEDGAEVNNISDANATDLTDGGETTLHTHAISGVTGLQAALDSKITAFADPNADRIVFWDDSASAFAALTASTGLTLSGTNLTVRSASETVTGIAERATNAEFTTGTDTTRYVSANQVANVAQTLTNKTLGTGTTNGADQDVAGFDLRDIALSGFRITTASVSGTTAINWNDGAFQEITLTGNTTLTFTAPTGDANNGWRLQLLVKQDATGGRTLALPTVKTPGGAAYTVSSGANDEDILTFYYNGVSYYLVDSKDFS